MKKRFSPGIILTAVVFIAFLAACGSSGDGGTTLTNHYDGKTAAASIGNIADAEEIVVEVYENGDMMGAAGMADPSMIIASKALSLATETLRAAALYSGEMPFDSDLECTDNTGSATVKFSMELSGKYSMTMTFNNFCEWYATGEDYTDGSVSVSGSYDLTTGEVKSATLTMNSLNMKEWDLTATPETLTEDFTVSAKVTMSVSGDTTTMTQNMTAKDNQSGESFKVENYKVSVTVTKDAFDNVVSTEITVTSGKFYHSAHGYVSISTSTPMVIDGANEYPTTGVIVLTGDGWTAELDFDDASPTRLNEATLSVDFDNDTVFDASVEVDLSQ